MGRSELVTPLYSDFHLVAHNLLLLPFRLLTHMYVATVLSEYESVDIHVHS